MFSYIIEGSQLIIHITSELRFGFDYLNELTEMCYRALNSEIKEIRLRCKSSFKSDKLCVAYLKCLLILFVKQKKVFWTRELKSAVLNFVKSKSEKKFEKLTMEDLIHQGNIQLYIFENDEYIAQAVENIVELLVNNNIVIGEPAKVREFLSTTIGEIFSNAVNHSNLNKFYFTYDLIVDGLDSNFYLDVNIIDFGKTLVENVKEFFAQKGKAITDIDCFRWAIEEGNTTRIGSGGFGLPTFISYLKSVNGEMMIFSGNAVCSLNGKQVSEKHSLGEFPGTAVSFRVKMFDFERLISFDSDSTKIVSEIINLEEI